LRPPCRSHAATRRSPAARTRSWSRRVGALTSSVFAALVLFFAPQLALARPYIWDNDGDKIDDRIETVHAGGYPQGYQFSFESGDTLLRQRFSVLPTPGGGLVYNVFVVYDHDPTTTDLANLVLLGMPVLQRYRYVPAVRSVATFAQIQQATTLAGVEGVEAVPILYPMDRVGVAAIGARDPSAQVFPTAEGVGAPDGEGVVVAFLDTGINDQTSGSFPGHESVRGRFLGGATFLGGDSTFDTPRDGSMNPIDHGDAHGTHVAGIALGDGGEADFAYGVASQARFVDVKVLNDAGVGTGIPEGLDWCIHNRTRDWGAGSEWIGIDVINLSLSSLDRSDGNDVASRLAARAVELGIVVVASVGNEGNGAHIPSPAAGDGVLAIGAVDDQRTPRNGDDLWPGFNDYGPRDGDGDVDAADEQKPDLLAPGVAVLSADGRTTTDGEQYRRLTGTSMAAAHVSGVVAVIRSAYPALTPAQIAELLRSTAVRTLSSPGNGVGPDPRWRSGIGYGVVDLYGAWLELQQPARSQVRRIALSSTDTEMTATLWTQRELGAQHFVFERAPDVGGTPGSFTPYDSVGAAGDGSLLDIGNLTSYPRTWAVPENERGAAFWYRVAYTEGGQRYDSPALRFVGPVGPPAATIEVVVVHNAYDNDVSGEISLAGPEEAAKQGTSSFSFPLPASGAAVSSDFVTGISATGNIAWTFRILVPAGVADAYLPPTAQNPWWLSVADEGYLNRSGRVTSYTITWHSPAGDLTYSGGPTPQQTIEGQTVWLTSPVSAVGVDPISSRRFRFGPNPVAAGQSVGFALGGAAGAMRVFDVSGREVGRIEPSKSGSFDVRWTSRDAAGSPLPSGLYFARVGERSVARLVVLAR
jgi:subtilisin family serine protease